MSGYFQREAERQEDEVAEMCRLEAEIERLREQMERAAIACAHLEAQAARQILLDALSPNAVYPTEG